MKLKLTLSALMLALALQLDANPIDRAEARQIAQQFVAINDQTTDEVALAPYYVFSRGAGAGFVIVSGDDQTAPIFGYTDMGDFDYDSMPEPLQRMLDAFAEKVKQAQAANKGKRQVKRSIGERLSQARRGVAAFKANWTDVAPLIQTHWHQSSPYNDLCPTDSAGNRAVTGCVATAGAQIAYYFRRDNPTELLHATPTYSYGFPVTRSFPAGTPVRYDLMRLSGYGTAAQDSAVAVLMAAIGAQSWLTYGNSTSGYTYKLGEALAYQMGLQGETISKYSYTQTAWEQMIFQNVSGGRPVSYAGSNPKDGGHEVVLDGYQSNSGLYHFNFGWGGQGDGYYTVDDSTGMHGFYEYQEMLCNLTPKKPNLNAQLTVAPFYAKTQGNIHVDLANDGTLAYKGVHVYCTSGSNPSQGTPTVSESETSVAAGATASFDFVYRPLTGKKVMVWVTDNNFNLLDSVTVPILNSIPDIHLSRFGVDAGNQTVEKDGVAYQVVNNTTANISAGFMNGEQGTYCQPILRCKLLSLDEATGKWNQVTSMSLTTLTFENGQSRDTIFTFNRLTPGVYYKAEMDSVVRAGEKTDMVFDAENAVYFMVKASDLTFTVSADGRSAVVGGAWNATRFAELNIHPAVRSYDMTAVTELNSRPEGCDENALFYTAQPLPGEKNIIAGGVCDSLVIIKGHDFVPATAFTARKAKLVLTGAEPGVWGDVVVPFKATVPEGMQAKLLSKKSYYKLDIAYTRNVEAMTPILYLTSRKALTSIDAENVEIGTDTLATMPDEFCFGYTVASTADDNTMLLGEKYDAPFYLDAEQGTPIAAFATALRSQYSNGVGTYGNTIVERNYIEQALALSLAYDVLGQNDQASEADVAELQAAIRSAETMFSTEEAEDRDVIKAETQALNEAIEKYLSAVAEGIGEVSVPERAAAGNEQVEYYDLSGRRIDRPATGIVIVKRGNSVRKMVIR